jgi:beta-galactosidase
MYIRGSVVTTISATTTFRYLPMMNPAVEIRDDSFLIHGKATRIIGGAMHYPRVPRAYWRDRMQKLVDLGCNTLETYAFWNAHEPYPGQFDFSGDLDVAAYIELAGSMGLNVIFRPGPYVCAEWDMGGLPWWLLAQDGMQLRCSYGPYLQAVDRWFAELIKRVAPLQAGHGGPIIAMQIENEYGYYGNDTAYLQHLHNLLRSLGVDVPLVTSDGTFQELTIHNGGLPNVLRTANFGSTAPDRIRVLKKYQPTGPLMCMEFWVGWFDEWRSAKHVTRPADECAKEFQSLLDQNAHAVIYKFHGGTNFGFTAGGNLSERFQPFVTSYDYDALLTESGDITPKYRAFQKIVRETLKLKSPVAEASAMKKTAYGKLMLTHACSLTDALPRISKAVESAAPLPMELLGHGRGFVLYSTTVSAIYRGEKLVIRGMHDWCSIRINNQPIATWYRNDPQPDIILDFTTETATIEILVHSLARSNFGHQMTERKGITGGVYVGAKLHDERALFGWTHHAVPLNDIKDVPFLSMKNDPDLSTQPAFYRGTLRITGDPTDTFLSLDNFELGCAFINGVNLGRYWNVGPQQTLYVPGPLLRTGENEVVIFEAVGCSQPEVSFESEPRLG